VQVYPLGGAGSSAVEYEVLPNFSSRPRTATVNIAGRPFTVTQPGAPGTPDERFVGLTYFNFLSRLPSSSETASQAAVLGAGTTRAQFASALFQSEEFNLGGRFVAGLYVGLLARDAEYTGFLFQRSALSSGAVSQTQLVGNFVNSEEYRLKFGMPAAPQFVTLLYRHVLLREPAMQEVAFHVNTLLTPDTPANRVELARRFLNSQEFREGANARLTAFLLYATLLHRDATETERELIRLRIASGEPSLSVIQDFVTSAEFNLLLS
jgi:hypothetical protein